MNESSAESSLSISAYNTGEDNIRPKPISPIPVTSYVTNVTLSKKQCELCSKGDSEVICL